MIATGSFDKTAKVWHVQSGECIGELIGHTAEVVAVQFSPDSELIGKCSSFNISTSTLHKCLKIQQIVNPNRLSIRQNFRKIQIIKNKL